MDTKSQELGGKNNQAKACDVSSLFVDDSGIELYQSAALHSNGICEREEIVQVKNGVDNSQRGSHKNSKSSDHLSNVKSNYYNNLLLNFLSFKLKVELASEIMRLQGKKLVDQAKKGFLERLCKSKKANISSIMKDCEIKIDNGDGLSIFTPKIVITPPEEDLKIKSEDNSTSSAKTTIKNEEKGVPVILSEFRAAIKENKLLRRNIKGYRSLNEDLRIKHREYQNETEKMLAKLGEYVMNTRAVVAESDKLKDLLQQANSERLFTMKRLKECRAMIEDLQQKVIEAEKTARFFRNQVAALKSSRKNKEFEESASTED